MTYFGDPLYGGAKYVAIGQCAYCGGNLRAGHMCRELTAELQKFRADFVPRNEPLLTRERLIF